MKKLGLLIFSLVFLAAGTFAQKTTAEAKDASFAEFEHVVHDFGKISPNEDAFFDFKFVNTSGAPLLLNPPKTSCGCTTPYYPKEPIGVGAGETMKVKYSTKGRIGKFNKQIRVYAQGHDQPILLTIKGEVLPPEVVETKPTKKSNSLFKDN